VVRARVQHRDATPNRRLGVRRLDLSTRSGGRDRTGSRLASALRVLAFMTAAIAVTYATGLVVLFVLKDAGLTGLHYTRVRRST
jgi:hypothetical protein